MSGINPYFVLASVAAYGGGGGGPVAPVQGAASLHSSRSYQTDQQELTSAARLKELAKRAKKGGDYGHGLNRRSRANGQSQEPALPTSEQVLSAFNNTIETLQRSVLNLSGKWEPLQRPTPNVSPDGPLVVSKSSPPSPQSSFFRESDILDSERAVQNEYFKTPEGQALIRAVASEFPLEQPGARNAVLAVLTGQRTTTRLSIESDQVVNSALKTFFRIASRRQILDKMLIAFDKTGDKMRLFNKGLLQAHAKFEGKPVGTYVDHYSTFDHLTSNFSGCIGDRPEETSSGVISQQECQDNFSRAGLALGQSPEASRDLAQFRFPIQDDEVHLKVLKEKDRLDFLKEKDDLTENSFEEYRAVYNKFIDKGYSTEQVNQFFEVTSPFEFTFPTLKSDGTQPEISLFKYTPDTTDVFVCVPHEVMFSIAERDETGRITEFVMPEVEVLLSEEQRAILETVSKALV